MRRRFVGGQPEREGRTTADLALDRDVAPEGTRDPPADRQAEAQAACRRGGRVRPVEFLEDALAVLRRDPWPRVGNGQRKPAAATTRATFGDGRAHGDPAP